MWVTRKRLRGVERERDSLLATCGDHSALMRAIHSMMDLVDVPKGELLSRAQFLVRGRSRDAERVVSANRERYAAVKARDEEIEKVSSACSAAGINLDFGVEAQDAVQYLVNSRSELLSERDQLIRDRDQARNERDAMSAQPSDAVAAGGAAALVSTDREKAGLIPIAEHHAALDAEREAIAERIGGAAEFCAPKSGDGEFWIAAAEEIRERIGMERKPATEEVPS